MRSDPSRQEASGQSAGNEQPTGGQGAVQQQAGRQEVDLGPYLALLKQYWGYDGFRGVQAEIISNIAQGRDTLGLMPTSGGKSITFQVPALAMEGVCIVVSPLIALMKDQVYNLRHRGIKATAIYSGMSQQEIVVALENCILGDYKLLYVSPERIDTPLFRAKLRHIKVSLIAVDESHCISQWGYDFRPSYLKVAELRDLLAKTVPILALTASATPEVARDIQEKLHFRRENVVRMSFARNNLCYVVRRTSDKYSELRHILRHTTGSAIVYVRKRELTRQIAKDLCDDGFTADFYHAGLDTAMRDHRQQDWTADRTRIIVATNAFGMGIDKPDVRLVVHIDLPDSLEAYFQEAGRAGRDGQLAYAVLLYSEKDQDGERSSRRLERQFPSHDYIKKVYQDLQYYYQMAMGDGLGCVKLLDIDDFGRKFRHYPPTAVGALRLLSLAGYLEYVEEPERTSLLMFTVRRDELYHLHYLGSAAERIISTVLRLYTGLFAQLTTISEDTIALECGSEREEVYQQLLYLSRQGIVKYIPMGALPRIVYRRERVELYELQIPHAVYEGRRERYAQRVAAMIAYAASEDTCRSQLLLRYFGETDAPNCGICDVCRRLHLRASDKADGTGDKVDGTGLPAEVDSSTATGRPETDLNPVGRKPTEAELRQAILDRVAQGPVSPNRLFFDLNAEREALIDLVRRMIDEGALGLDCGHIVRA